MYGLWVDITHFPLTHFPLTYIHLTQHPYPFKIVLTQRITLVDQFPSCFFLIPTLSAAYRHTGPSHSAPCVLHGRSPTYPSRPTEKTSMVRAKRHRKIETKIKAAVTSVRVTRFMSYESLAGSKMLSASIHPPCEQSGMERERVGGSGEGGMRGRGRYRHSNQQEEVALLDE